MLHFLKSFLSHNRSFRVNFQSDSSWRAVEMSTGLLIRGNRQLEEASGSLKQVEFVENWKVSFFDDLGWCKGFEFPSYFVA